MNQSSLYRYGTLGLILLVATGLFIANRLPAVPDDALITYRYAENIASGKGFVYNAGEPIIGTTTPLYTLLLAGFGWVGFDIPTVSRLVGLFASLSIIVTGHVMAYKARGGWGLAITTSGLLVVTPFFVEYALGGMEAPLYTLFILLAIYFYNPEAMLLAVIAAALATWTRIDGGIVAVAIFLTFLLQTRRIPWRAGFTYAGLIAPWFIFAYLYTGSLMPSSLDSKQNLAPLFSEQNMWIIRFMTWSDVATGLLLLGIPFLAVQLWKREAFSKTYMPLVIWLVMYVIAYIAVRFAGVSSWYAVPSLVGMYILVAAGLYALGVTIQQRLPVSLTYRKYVPAALSFGLFLVCLPSLYTGMMDRTTVAVRWAANFTAEREAMSKWIEEDVEICSRILAGAIGYIGYENLDTYIYDAAGLVTDRQDSDLQSRLFNNDLDCFHAVSGWAFTNREIPDAVTQRYTQIYKQGTRTNIDLEFWVRNDKLAQLTLDTGNPLYISSDAIMYPQANDETDTQ